MAVGRAQISWRIWIVATSRGHTTARLATKMGDPEVFVDSGKQDPLEWIVSILEALSPRQFDRARLDGPAR